jgi:ketosteroid isomerase-like protein
MKLKEVKKMRPNFALFIIVCLFLITSCNQSTQNQDIINEMYPEEQAVIKNLVQEIFDCVTEKDIDKLESFHLYGPKFTRFSDGGPKRVDANGTKEFERDAVAAIDKFTFKIEDFKADVFGKVAVATYIIDYYIKMGEIDASAKELGTFVLVKVDDNWKITHEHFSPLKSNE